MEQAGLDREGGSYANVLNKHTIFSSALSLSHCHIDYEAKSNYKAKFQVFLD